MTSYNLISYEKLSSGIGLIRLGLPEEKVIILSRERLEKLEETLISIAKDLPKGLIIAGNSEGMFSAGADINVIQAIADANEGQALAKKGQDVFNLIENLPIKTVAAISGPCVGGACELALACSFRVISDNDKSSIGLPEVKIGILPGFGGTQRLPRLIGLTESLKIILSGNVLRSWKAKKVGLVDAVVAYKDLITAAEGLINNPSSVKPRMSFKDNLITKIPFIRNFVANIAKKDLLKKTNGHYPAPLRALDCVLYGLAEGKTKGFIYEARGLGELIVTPECKALANLFFLSENAKGIGKSAKEYIKNLNTLVIGSGIMGAGIAGELARNQYPVILKDTKQEAINAGLETIKKNLSYRQSLTEQDQANILQSVRGITEYTEDALAKVNFVIEAIFENLELKSIILEEAACRVAPNAIIASNTSSLSITEIANHIPNPERVVGMHFFNPVPQLPLVEIIRGHQTSDQTICLIAALATKIGKFPIVVEDVPGFLVNRILSAYLNEAAFLLQDGFTIPDIDNAALNFGLPMGPIRLLDQIGLDVASHVYKTMINGYGKRMAAPNHVEKLLLADRIGKKSSLGFYNYQTKKAVLDPKVYDILEIKTFKPNDTQHIQDRLILSLINEAVLCLDEGVAGTPGRDAARQIDLGTVMGTGFPAFRGGVIYYANSIGAAKLVHMMQSLERQIDARFRPVTGILTRAEKGIGFYE